MVIIASLIDGQFHCRRNQEFLINKDSKHPSLLIHVYVLLFKTVLRTSLPKLGECRSRSPNRCRVLWAQLPLIRRRILILLPCSSLTTCGNFAVLNSFGAGALPVTAHPARPVPAPHATFGRLFVPCLRPLNFKPKAESGPLCSECHPLKKLDSLDL